ncbi:hypothetical protein B0H14DRAFT_3883883 [Mycena olivaceomarginata]|nr:hypothetical protein B0H14DRAFT_3883883 [Mycena olivaceomarginata]
MRCCLHIDPRRAAVVTTPPAPMRRLQFTDCMLENRRRRKLSTQRCSTPPAPIPRLRFTDCMLTAPDTLAEVLLRRPHEHIERVCPSLCPALDLSLSLFPPSFAFSPFPPRLIPSDRSLPTHRATASIPQYRLALSARADSRAALLCGSGSSSKHGLAIHQAHTSPPILSSSSTLFPSRLNIRPALLASGRLLRLASSENGPL